MRALGGGDALLPPGLVPAVSEAKAESGCELPLPLRIVSRYPIAPKLIRRAIEGLAGLLAASPDKGATASPSSTADSSAFSDTPRGRDAKLLSLRVSKAVWPAEVRVGEADRPRAETDSLRERCCCCCCCAKACAMAFVRPVLAAAMSTTGWRANMSAKEELRLRAAGAEEEPWSWLSEAMTLEQT